MKIDYILVIIYFGTFLQYSNQTVISSFYPQFAKNKYGMSQISIGFVFSAQSIGVFITSIAIAKYMSKPGMKKIFVVSGLLLSAFSQVIAGLTYKIDDSLTFEIISIAARIILGIGTGLFICPIYSYVSILYYDTMEEKIGQIEFCSGFGASFGPMMGGILYQYGGYLLPFFVSLCLGLILIPLSHKYLPSDEILDQISEDAVEQSQNDQSSIQDIEHSEMSDMIISIGKKKSNIISKSKRENSISFDKRISRANSILPQYFEKDFEMSDLRIKLLDNINILDNSMSLDEAIQDQNSQIQYEKTNYDISFLNLLQNKQIILAYILIQIPPNIHGYFDACLGNYLQDQYGFSESLVGFTFLCGSFSYLIFVVLTVKLTTKITKTRWLIFFGILIKGFSLWIIGPSLSIPDHVIFPQLGMMLFNLGYSLINIPVIPDLVATLKFQYSDYPDEIIGDICSTIYNNSSSFGYILGPAVGGALVEFFGFKMVSFFLGILILVYGIIYYFICVNNNTNFKTEEIAISEQSVCKRILKRIPTLNKKTGRSYILIRPESYSSINVKKNDQSVQSEQIIYKKTKTAKSTQSCH